MTRRVIVKYYSRQLIVVWILVTALGIVEAVSAMDLYYTNRTFTAVNFNIQGTPPPVDLLNSESARLTNIVQGAAITTNIPETYVIEKEVIAIGYSNTTAEAVWNTAVNALQEVRRYLGQIREHVGWVRGTRQEDGKWGAYLWMAQNRIMFKSSETNWWISPSNGIPVAITNVIVGSMEDIYEPLEEDVLDIGPPLAWATNDFPGENTGDEGDYRVDVTNVFYVLVIPDIYITPRNAVTCVDGSNVEFTVTGTNIPSGVTWTLYLTNFAGHATITPNGNQASVTPGTVATNYKVRATSVDNTNFYDEVGLTVVKVDIVETNIYLAVSNTTTLHLTPDSSTNVQWEITPSVQTGASIQGSSVGTSVVIIAGSIPTNYTVRAYAIDYTNCYDTCTVTVLKISLIQMGFDCTDTNKEVTLRKTGTGSYTNAIYSSDGDTTITNPVWLDQNLDHIPDFNPPDPVCFLPGAIPIIAGTVSKLSVQPDIGSATSSCKLKVEAIPQGAAGTVETITFGPVDLVLSNSTVDLPEIIAASNKTVGSVVNNFDYEMHWQLSTDGGTTWPYEFQTMTQRVFVVYDKPQTNYCSNIDFWSLPYSWSSLAWTAKRMDWATEQGMGENTGDGMAMQIAVAINNDPGTPDDAHDPDTYYANSFTQLDTPDPNQTKICHPGDCISLANLAATALRLLGTNACPARAYCNNSNDVSNSETWGWIRRYTHSVHTNWFLGYPRNNFEGFFYYGVTNPPASSNFPSKGWTVWPVRSVTMGSGKETFLPTAILSNVPVSQLQWQAVNLPDVEWVTNAISGVTFNDPNPNIYHCTNWAVGADGQYSIEWNTNSSTLSLSGGDAVVVTNNGWYSLSCSNGSIWVTNVAAQLPNNNQTGTVSIVPARTLAPVP